MVSFMIQLKNVSKYYNNNGNVSLGLRNINLNLNKGEIVAIVGESGSGKHLLCEVIRNKFNLELSNSFDDFTKPTQVIIEFNSLKDKDIQALLKTLEEPSANAFIVI